MLSTRLNLNYNQVFDLVEYQDQIYLAANNYNQESSALLSTSDLSTTSTIIDLQADYSDSGKLVTLTVYNDKLYMGTTTGSLYVYDGTSHQLVNSFSAPIVLLIEFNSYLWILTKSGDLYMMNFFEVITFLNTSPTRLTSACVFQNKLLVTTSKRVYSVDIANTITDLGSPLEDNQKTVTLITCTSTRAYLFTSDPLVNFYSSTDGVSFTRYHIDHEHRFATKACVDNFDVFVTGTDRACVWRLKDTIVPTTLVTIDTNAFLCALVLDNSTISLEKELLVVGEVDTSLYSTAGIYFGDLVNDLLLSPGNWERFAQVSVAHAYEVTPSQAGAVTGLFPTSIGGLDYLVAATSPSGKAWRARAQEWTRVAASRDSELLDFTVWDNKWWWCTNAGKIHVYTGTIDFMYSDVAFVQERILSIPSITTDNSKLFALVVYPDGSESSIRTLSTPSSNTSANTNQGYPLTTELTLSGERGTDLLFYNNYLWLSCKSGQVYKIDPSDFSYTNVPLMLAGLQTVTFLKVLDGELYAFVEYENVTRLQRIYHLTQFGWVLFKELNIGLMLDAIGFDGFLWVVSEKRAVYRISENTLTVDQTFDWNTISLAVYENKLVLGLSDEIGSIWIRRSL